MDDLISRLMDLGLSEYEANIYCLLLKREYATASEIAKLTQISRPRVYSLLANLVAKNFCPDIVRFVFCVKRKIFFLFFINDKITKMALIEYKRYTKIN
ncbi:MAG: Sugar-specific transcriptional regulator TrmB [Candidatus Cloacimonadota bacterium]|nr:Sugar-specific transcriptional regulator TrmB [Candidatus Cloacimonadota bacterium]